MWNSIGQYNGIVMHLIFMLIQTLEVFIVEPQTCQKVEAEK